MTKNWIIAPLLAIAVTGCVSNDDKRAAVRGALIGAAGGAAVSAITGGDLAEGAAIGAAGGAAIGVITQDGRKREVYRDRDGRRYWVDDRGRRRHMSDRH